MAYVYRHIRLDNNEPFYIGIGSDSNYKRANFTRKRNIFWQRITAKTEYEVEIMLDDLTWEEANTKEIEFISLYGRSNLNKGPLCNLTDGGGGILGVKMSDETRLKMSQKVFTEETRRKISKANSGENNAFYGKPLSEATRIKLSEAQKGEKSKWWGKKHTEETKNKIREKAIGRRKGAKASPETIAKMRLARTINKKIYRIVDGILIPYHSHNEVVKELHISSRTIHKHPERFGLLNFEQLPDIYKKMITEESPL